MKKLFIPMVVLVIGLTLFLSCGEAGMEEDTDIILNEVLFEENEYNLNFRDFTVAVSQALSSSPDFRKVVKEEALKMFDGDYDVLLTRVMNKKVSAPVMYKSAGKNYTVKDLLNDSFSSSSRMRLNKSSTSSTVIDEISEMYPDMQIAVPVHAEEWDAVNYIPTVTFIPQEFDAASTTIITGYNSEGNMVAINANIEPDDPVIVVSENERNLAIEEDPIIPIEVLVPMNLTGVQTESGIRLTWDMLTIASPENVTGYYVYRKAASDNTYILVQTIPGVYNRSYDDNNVDANASYSYYVMSYYQIYTSPPSNYITVTAPSFPNPVISFDVIQHALNEIELRWENDHSQYLSGTNIYKHVVGITNDYELFGTYSANDSYCFDHNVSVGYKMIYKINHVSSVGESNSKYDFVHAPYRDMSQNSPVYIKQIKFTDWSIEPWIYGKPEFTVIVSNVDHSTQNTYIVQENIDCRFNSRTNISQVFYDKLALNWNPGFWYDMLTFTVIEYDRSFGSLTLYLSAAYGIKDLGKIPGLDIGAGIDYEYVFENKGEVCGNTTLGYYDDPEKWLQCPNYGVQVLVSESDN